jgi:hypothetical protein
VRDARGFHGHATRRAESTDGFGIGTEMVLGLGDDPSPQTASDADRDQLTLQLGEHLLDHVSTDSTALANDFHSLRSRSSSARPRRVSR